MVEHRGQGDSGEDLLQEAPKTGGSDKVDDKIWTYMVYRDQNTTRWKRTRSLTHHCPIPTRPLMDSKEPEDNAEADA
ncbi:hypothetical protein IscW_ISCW002467 [Ixodes scapularis]|uniref:Uncharacterized protein n=1 Tax=Ixodes scapularis TaxID=6945 RepID=B7P9H8_IXOSC|nr:hypothetical protein IscW_ISCW002467 [Ixodes scapularis]|eukprot:XP_002404427.1 hypothetical protein IscW_ISCW002467 [Ixodes scapularis]